MNNNRPFLDVQASGYHKLLSGDNEQPGGRNMEWQQIHSSKRHGTAMILRLTNHVLPWSITIALSIYVIVGETWGPNRFQQTKLFPSQMTYSPIQSEIEYRMQTFDHNLVNSPVEYQDPSTVDAAWASLYDVGGASGLTMSEARNIPNATIGRTNDGTKTYMVQLDVFHQLHCLDILRQSLEPFYGLKNDSLTRLEANGGLQQLKKLPKRAHETDDPRPWHIIGNIKHLNHCLNTLRQSLMCHSDVSVNVWQWFEPPDDLVDPFDELYAGTFPSTNIPHTCRNFEKLQDWARSRQLHHVPDFTTKPEETTFRIPTWPPSND